MGAVTPRHRRRARLIPLAVAWVSVVACSDAGGDSADVTLARSPSSSPDASSTTTASSSTTTTATPTTVATTTTSASPGPSTTSRVATTSTTITTSTTTTTTNPPTTTTTEPAPRVPSAAGTDLVPYTRLDLSADTVALGRSVLGTPIIAERLGTPGGRRVLVIGVIHGDEDAGVAIVDNLRALGAPEGIELWLVEAMNPDGQAAQDRHNANQVDLNRNVPYNWQPLGVAGDGQYAGPGAASEPETQAMVNFIAQLRPDIAIWYHQDLYVISPGEGRDGRIRARYAELTGLPMGGISGGTYTGIAATWARRELAADESVAFIVELGATLSPEEALMHAEAVRTIASEG
jgi:protein MpaA